MRRKPKGTLIENATIMPETEARRAVAAETLARRKLERGESTKAELFAEATREAWEHCENLARQRNPGDSNLAQAIHREIYGELEVSEDDALQRLVSARSSNRRRDSH